MDKQKLSSMAKSWQERAKRHLQLAEMEKTQSNKHILEQSAIVNINLASKLLVMAEGIEDEVAQQKVLQEVIPCSTRRDELVERIGRGFYIP